MTRLVVIQSIQLYSSPNTKIILVLIYCCFQILFRYDTVPRYEKQMVDTLKINRHVPIMVSANGVTKSEL